MHTADFDIIIQKLRHQFKGNISIDKVNFRPYRTIILQPPQTKRLTAVKFFEKKLRNSPSNVKFLLLKKSSVHNGRNNIVKDMSAGCNPETANRKKNSKINTCNCPKTKLR